jgi:hypothetical protein
MEFGFFYNMTAINSSQTFFESKNDIQMLGQNHLKSFKWAQKRMEEECHNKTLWKHVLIDGTNSGSCLCCLLPGIIGFN